MEPKTTLSAGAFVAMQFQIEDSFGIAGIPAILGAAADGGVQTSATTGPAAGLGIAINAQTAINTAALVTVVVNPDLVCRAKLSGGSASDTALAAFTATTGSANTNVVTTASPSAPNSPDLDDGTIWPYSGSLVGNSYRAVTAADGTTFTVANVWSSVPVSGDEFLAIACPAPGGLIGFVTLTTELDQVDATDDAATANWVVLGGEYNDLGNDGTTNSFIHVVMTDHALS